MLDTSIIKFKPIEHNGETFLNIWTPEWTNQKLNHGIDASYSQNKKLLIQMHKLERYIALSPNLDGWVTWVYHQYPRVKRIVEKLGGKELVRTFHSVWYVKRKKDFDHVR